MEMKFDEIVLRDYRLSDVEDEVRWTNTDTAWFYADTPWMTMEPVDPGELREDMRHIISELSEDAIRWRFEIEADGRHIGMVSSYFLDENFETDFWGRGIGGKALTAFMEYYRGLGERRFLLETWSGNVRMLGCARKLGFVEVKRQKGAYVVDGKAYDGLTLEKRI